MYAIVRAGGRQEKVSVGETLVVDRLSGDAGDTVELPAVLVVDGSSVTSDAAALAQVKVTAQIVRATKGPKINILRFKNKTGYRRRMGHRSALTEVRVTAIGDEREQPRATRAAKAEPAPAPAPTKAKTPEKGKSGEKGKSPEGNSKVAPAAEAEAAPPTEAATND